jgi:class 3 adenylate cyclase
VDTVRCASCHTELPAAARFCPGCGAAAAPAGRAFETRKVVTVVFCDLVGSTALSGRLDSEILRTVTLRYFELMTARIEAYGGTVEKFIGDAIMAVFGVPVTHEDDARRAVAAALDMLGSLGAFNDDLEAAFGVRLDVRIGVNTGEVVATADASVRQALVSGEVVNVAARLEQAAPAGQILIGPETRYAAGGAVDAEPTAPLLLKGVAGEVTAYRLLGIRPDDPERERRFDLPFVGREPELAALRGIAARAEREARCRLVLVLGEAGIGKTRLVREWAAGPGRPALGAGRCHPYRDHGSLAPLADALRQLLADPAAVERDPPGATALETLRGGLLADGTPTPTLGDTCAAVACVLRLLARDRLAVLALDDCHWADPTLLDAVDRLADALRDAPVLIACLGRPELLDGHPEWAEQPAERILLPPLTAGQSAVLAAQLGEVTAHAATTEALERAEGNPFLLEQLLTALAENGPRDRLPPTVHGLLAARVDALPAAERAALDRAAVIGRDFDLDALASLAESAALPRPGGHPRAVLVALARRRLIEAVGTAYRFSSALVQEVTYQGIPKRARADLHELLAQVLDAGGAGDAVIGGHLERACRYRLGLGLHDAHAEGLRVAAVGRLTAAGSTALSRADLSWSADLLTRATDLARPPEPAWVAAGHRLGESLVLLGRTGEGVALLGRVLAAAEQAGDDRIAAHTRLHLASLDPGTGMATAAAVARESVPVFEAAGDDLGLARAYLRIAQEQQFLGRHGMAVRLLDVSFRHAVGADAEPERAMALGAAGISLWLGPTPAVDGIERCAALLAGQGAGRRVVRLVLNCPLAVLLSLRCRFAEAAACLRDAEAAARELAYAEAELFMPIFAAQVEYLAGRLEPAERLLRRAVEVGRRAGDGPLLAVASRDLARVLLRAGDTALAPPFAEQGGGDAAQAPAEAADLDGIRARIAAADGRPADAVTLAEAAMAAAARTESPVIQAVAALDSAETYRLLGDPARATAAADTARRRFGAKGHLVGAGWVTEFGRR